MIHTGFSVTDIDAAIQFYRDAFGYELVLEDREMEQLIASVTGLAGLRAELAQMRRPGTDKAVEFIAFHDVPDSGPALAPVLPGQGHLCFEVADLDDSLQRLTALGAKLVGDVTTFPEGEGRSVYLQEPGGTVIELEEVLEPPR